MTDSKKPTLIWTEIDYDKKGKQVGVLHLPYSVTRSGYGMINIPIAVIQNGEGPSILLMAGNHGDEYEGQVTLARLIHDLETSRHPGPGHHPARGQSAGGHGGCPRLAAGFRQSQSRLSRRSRGHADLADHPLHRERAVAEMLRPGSTCIPAAARWTICPSPPSMRPATTRIWMPAAMPSCGPSARRAASR